MRLLLSTSRRRDGTWRRHLKVIRGHVCPSARAAGLFKDRTGRGRGQRTAAQLADEPVTKTAVEHDVDDKVDRRVYDQHCVGDLADCLDQIALIG